MSYPNDDLTDEDLAFSDWLHDALEQVQDSTDFQAAAWKSFKSGEEPEKFAARVLERLAAINQRLETDGR